MRLSLTPLKISGLSAPRHPNDHLYTRTLRTVWTPDGEIHVPRKKPPRHPGFSGWIGNIWMRDDRGKLLLWDPVGEHNDLSDGALWDILNFAFGHWSATNALFGLNTGGDFGPNTQGPWYSDGTYNFPNVNDLIAYYNGTDTYWAPPALAFSLSQSLFGNLWFMDGTSGGMTGSHLPSATAAAGFSVPYGAGSEPQSGWFSGVPTTALSGNTTLSDSVALETQSIQHTITLSTSSSATAFSFDGLVWTPLNVGYMEAANETSPSYYAAGNVPTTVGLTWGSSSSSPSTVSDLMVADLWNPGFVSTLNPGASWGFVWTLQV